MRYHIAKNGSTSLVHRQDYGITSVPVRYTIEATGEPPIHYGALPVLYLSSTDINEAIPEYCRCSSVARSGSASAEIFKHVQKFLPSPAVANFVADVLTMSCRCTTVLTDVIPLRGRIVPIPENRQICAPVLLRRAKSVRCDSALWLCARVLVCMCALRLGSSSLSKLKTTYFGFQRRITVRREIGDPSQSIPD